MIGFPRCSTIASSQRPLLILVVESWVHDRRRAAPGQYEEPRWGESHRAHWVFKSRDTEAPRRNARATILRVHQQGMIVWPSREGRVRGRSEQLGAAAPRHFQLDGDAGLIDKASGVIFHSTAFQTSHCSSISTRSYSGHQSGLLMKPSVPKALTASSQQTFSRDSAARTGHGMLMN